MTDINVQAMDDGDVLLSGSNHPVSFMVSLPRPMAERLAQELIALLAKTEGVPA